MPDHYFTDAPNSIHNERLLTLNYRGNEMRFTTDSGTFSRTRIDPGSALLLNAIGDITGDCADMGCAWGAVGLSLAKANPSAHIHMVDINERALELAVRNAHDNGVNNITCLKSDGLNGIDPTIRFTCVATNPPIHAGKDVIFSFFDQAHERLVKGGLLYIVIRKNQGMASAKQYLLPMFGNCETVARSNGYHILKCVKGENP